MGGSKATQRPQKRSAWLFWLLPLFWWLAPSGPSFTPCSWAPRSSKAVHRRCGSEDVCRSGESLWPEMFDWVKGTGMDVSDIQAFAPAVIANTCPGSSATFHASCQVAVTADATCSEVMSEMEARVAGISTGAWHDPHNNGTYSQQDKGANELTFQRLTGNKKYTDKLKFTFEDAPSGTCNIQGCSESQVFSVADFSTNYCNLRMLYCGSHENCKYMKKDFAITETSVSPSLGASKNAADCLKTVSEKFLSPPSPFAPPFQCPPAGFETVNNFDLDSFISKRWYIQQQMETKYLPKAQNRCVYAEYKLEQKKTFWGYDVAVHNHAEGVAPPHTPYDSGSKLCAKVVDKARGKLEVAPCFLPTLLAGPYWVLDYDEAAGYALISGGAPTLPAEAGCMTGSGTNGSGLWIFTREQERDEALVQKVRAIAAQKGFDLSVLNDVDQSACGSITQVVV
ncbi:unnamed protein product [Symbiodinium sp. CCMP2592]|nr:unnamed protein product [Symbiodinium sp. CCMP2592]